MTTRRGFLGAMLAAGMAPAIAKAGVLMPVRKIWTPPQDIALSEYGAVPDPAAILWGDGVHDDTLALQTFIDGGRVFRPDGTAFLGMMTTGVYKLSSVIEFRGDAPRSIVGSVLQWDKSKPGGVWVKEGCQRKSLVSCSLHDADTGILTGRYKAA